MLKLSLSTGTFYHLPLRSTFSLAQDVGFDGGELVLGPEILLRGAAYVRRLSQEYALPVFSVHPPIVPYPGHGKAGRILPRLISLAKEVDCPLVVLHTPKTAGSETPAWTEFVSAVQNQQTHGQVRVSLENGGLFRATDADFLLHDLHRLRAFADRYDLLLTLDTAHAGTAGYELLEAYGLLDGRLANVHYSDLVRRPLFPNWPPLYTFFRHHQMPGQGVLPLAGLIRALLARGYAGVLTVEVSPMALGAWRPSRARQRLASLVQSIRRLEAEFDELGPWIQIPG